MAASVCTKAKAIFLSYPPESHYIRPRRTSAELQTTAFWAVPYENERQSFVQFRSFTAENYKKIKQKKHEKEQNFRPKIQHDQSTKGSDNTLQADGTSAMVMNAAGSELSAGQGVRSEATEPSPVGAGCDCELTDSQSPMIEPQSNPTELSEFLTSPVLADEVFKTADPSMNCSASPAAQLLDGTSRLDYATDPGETSMSIGDIFRKDKGTVLQKGVALRALESGVTPADGRLVSHTYETRVSDSGAEADFASSTISDGTAFSKTQVITRTANADCIDDGSVLLQTPEASVIPQRLSKETTDPGQEWTQEKDDLLHHLRSTAGLSWARIALYFPHNSKSILRCKFAARVATMVEQEKSIHLLERKRGRPRKCEHPQSRIEQRRQSQTRTDRSQPLATRPYDRYAAPFASHPSANRSLQRFFVV